MIPISIVFSINDEYSDKLSVVIESVLANGGGDSYNFYILSRNISAKNIEKLNKIINEHKQVSTLRVIDPSSAISCDLNELMSRRRHYSYISTETYFRFFIHKILTELDKVLYLDADILVLGDVGEIYHLNLGDVYAGVVRDSWVQLLRQGQKYRTHTRPDLSFEAYVCDFLGVKNRHYFNAGVMLLNLKKMRKDRIDEKLLMFSKERGPLEFQDQDALNAVFGDSVYFIPLRWNLVKDAKCIKEEILDKEEQLRLEKAILNPGIIHYVGENKPWAVNVDEYDYIREWWKTYFKTGFCTPSDMERFKRIDKTSKYKDSVSYFLLRVGKVDVINIYRDRFRYKISILGRVVARKTMRIVRE